MTSHGVDAYKALKKDLLTDAVTLYNAYEEVDWLATVASNANVTI